MTEDLVNHPKHYVANRISFEPVDVTAFLPHPLASAVEYVLRAPFKGQEELDLEKAVWWLTYFADKYLPVAGADGVVADIPPRPSQYLRVYALDNAVVADLIASSRKLDALKITRVDACSAIKRIQLRLTQLAAKEATK